MNYLVVVGYSTAFICMLTEVAEWLSPAFCLCNYWNYKQCWAITIKAFICCIIILSLSGFLVQLYIVLFHRLHLVVSGLALYSSSKLIQQNQRYRPFLFHAFFFLLKNLVPTLPTMHFSYRVTSLEAIYHIIHQITWSYLGGHKKFYATFFT